MKNFTEKDAQLFSRMQAARKDTISFLMSEFAMFILIVMLVFDLNDSVIIILAITAMALALTTLVQRSLITHGNISPGKNRIPIFLLLIQGCGFLLLMLSRHLSVISIAIIITILAVHLLSFVLMWNSKS